MYYYHKIKVYKDEQEDFLTGDSPENFEINFRDLGSNWDSGKIYEDEAYYTDEFGDSYISIGFTSNDDPMAEAIEDAILDYDGNVEWFRKSSDGEVTHFYYSGGGIKTDEEEPPEGCEE